MKIGIVVQARMNSARLPGKVLKNLAGKPVLLWLIERLSALPGADFPMIVATSRRPENDAIENFCLEQGILCHRGSEEDVLSRFIEIARLQELDHVVRCTADNPLHDPVEIDFLLRAHLDSGADYSSNIDSLPHGIGAEIFSFQTLARLGAANTTPFEQEHVNEYILSHPGEFKIHRVGPRQKKYAGCRISFSIDTPEDFLRVEKICRQLLNSPPDKAWEKTARPLSLQ